MKVTAGFARVPDIARERTGRWDTFLEESYKTMIGKKLECLEITPDDEEAINPTSQALTFNRAIKRLKLKMVARSRDGKIYLVLK